MPSPRILRLALYVLIGVAGIAAPFLFPAYTFQVAVLWLMVMFALTWDIMGGQMGYNSLGNIFFFGAGMYISAVAQIGVFADVGEYTAQFGAVKVDFTEAQYFTGLALGIVAAAFGAALLAVLVGNAIFGLRGPYFAIGTLGIAFAAAELIGGVDYLGGGGGISMPVYPGAPDERSRFFYLLCFLLAIAAFWYVKWLYGRRFGLAINAIRDYEDKAEAMGLHTRRYKTVAWTSSAFFLGIAGALFGNMIGFIEPLEVAFPTITFGIFMVAMSLLGGKGTLWGPVIGAVAFHFVKEATWTFLLGWQWVALGLIIIVNIVYFQQGVMGWVRSRWPHLFGIAVEDEPARQPRRRPAQARAAE
jgi:branched-chain amino acid transport system permease protein